MKPNDQERFAVLLQNVMAYYRQDVSDFVQDLWWDACSGFDYEQIAKAMNAHAKNADNGQFAPKVADIVRILSGTTTDRAALAWGKTLDAMSSVGAYTDVVFDDPAIHAAVTDCGGWPRMCRTDLDDLSYLQKRFCDAHKAYTGRGTFEYPKRLPGDRSADAEYEKKGLPLPKPAIVGDLEQARLVYRGGSAGTAITHQSLAKLATLAIAKEKQ